jgi:hypothetical protein
VFPALFYAAGLPPPAPNTAYTRILIKSRPQLFSAEPAFEPEFA